VIGFVINVPSQNYARLMPARQDLSETGLTKDRMYRSTIAGQASSNDLPAVAAEMIARNPSVILAVGGTRHGARTT
jgi:hypothetical protein